MKGSQCYLRRTVRGLVVPVFIILDPGLSSVEILQVEGIPAPKFLKFLFQVIEHKWIDVCRRLRGDETDAELARYFSRDDRFGPRTIECAFDAMERERRVAHAPHQCGRLVFRNRNLSTCRYLHVLDSVVKVLEELPVARYKQ